MKNIPLGILVQVIDANLNGQPQVHAFTYVHVHIMFMYNVVMYRVHKLHQCFYCHFKLLSVINWHAKTSVHVGWWKKPQVNITPVCPYVVDYTIKLRFMTTSAALFLVQLQETSHFYLESHLCSVQLSWGDTTNKSKVFNIADTHTWKSILLQICLIIQPPLLG